MSCWGHLLAAAEMTNRNRGRSGELKPGNERGMMTERILNCAYTRDSSALCNLNITLKDGENRLLGWLLLDVITLKLHMQKKKRRLFVEPFRLRQILKLAWRAAIHHTVLTLLYPRGELCDARGQCINFKTRSCTDIQEVKRANQPASALPSRHVAGFHWGNRCGSHWVYPSVQLWNTCLHHFLSDSKWGSNFDIYRKHAMFGVLCLCKEKHDTNLALDLQI